MIPAGPAVEVEAWLLQRMSAPTLFDGVTTAEQRRERVREFLTERHLDLAIAGGGQRGKPETWSALFERVYGEPLRA